MNATAAVAVGSKVSAAVTKTAPKSALSSVTYATSDAAIATVDAKTGEVTGVKAGKATITATMTCGKETRTASTEVTVKNVLLRSVRQTKYNTIETVIEGNTKGLKNTDILITNKDTNIVCRVQSVGVDAGDATKVIITTFGSMVDGKVYTVKVDDVVKEFTATDNVIADVGVSPLQIASGDAGTLVVGQTLDKNGVVLTETKMKESGMNNITFIVNVNAADGYTDENQLILFKTGNKATAEITYHTYKYENGVETGAITKKFEIVAVDAKPVTVSGFNYTVQKNAPNWRKTTTPKTQIPVGDEGMKAYFNFVNSNNDRVTENYIVETSDRTTLLVDNTPITEGVKVIGLKEGSAYINVKDAKTGSFVTSLPVTVVPARKLGRVVMGASSLVIANTGSAVKLPVSVTGFDQYNDLTAVQIDGFTPVNTPGTVTAPALTVTRGGIEVNASGAKDTTFVYNLSVSGPAGSNQIVPFTVRVVTPAETDPAKVPARDCRLVFTPVSADVAVSEARTTTDDAIEVRVGAYSKGALVGYLDIEQASCTGGVAITTGSAAKIALFKEVDVVSDGSVKAWKSAYATGTYKVRVTASNGSLYTDDFTLTDSMKEEGAAVIKWSESRFIGFDKDDKVTTAKNAIIECLTVSCMGDTVALSASNLYVEPKDVTITNNAVFIKTAYVTCTINGIQFVVPFEVNMAFTAKQ